MGSDRDETQFAEYFADMPWKAVPFKNRDFKNAISSAFGIQGIPSVVVIDKDANVITDKGRNGVMSDSDATEFPWPQKDILNFCEDPGEINEFPSIVFMLDKIDKSAHKAKIELLEKLAAARKAECAKEDEDLDVRFFFVPETTGPANQIRNMMKIIDDASVTALGRIVFSLNHSQRQRWHP